jgi:hypothetical protein
LKASDLLAQAVTHFPPAFFAELKPIRLPGVNLGWHRLFPVGCNCSRRNRKSVFFDHLHLDGSNHETVADSQTRIRELLAIQQSAIGPPPDQATAASAQNQALHGLNLIVANAIGACSMRANGGLPFAKPDYFSVARAAVDPQNEVSQGKRQSAVVCSID